MEQVGNLVKAPQMSSQKPTKQIDNERWKQIKRLLAQSYEACNILPPAKSAKESETLQFKTDTFYSDLNGIPTKALAEVFRQARKAKFTPYPPTTGEIWKAWEDIKREVERKTEEGKKRNEPKALPKPFDIKLVKEFSRIALLPADQRIVEFEKLHKEYPLAGYDKEAERERERLNLPKGS